MNPNAHNTIGLKYPNGILILPFFNRLIIPTDQYDH